MANARRRHHRPLLCRRRAAQMVDPSLPLAPHLRNSVTLCDFRLRRPSAEAEPTFFGWVRRFLQKEGKPCPSGYFMKTSVSLCK
ncbi:unnamed protein product [Soboliphyme baturini]|uniref:Uncharacterized protein n=1 Tax=Soboliphyme baturini TaxID=241478 RepID=A0A183IX79_9BILA|nr:unnamed protein product [Soboliphyme baturini]